MKALHLLLSGSARTKVVKENILGSFLVKGLSIASSLYLVPFTINLLDQEKYGIWITIYSIVTWFNMMDVGLGNGFRNRFTEAVARADIQLARRYVQTLYSSTACLSLILLIVFSLLSFFLDWNAILNVRSDFDENLTVVIWCVFFFFCLQLILKNLSTILIALQKSYYSSLLLLTANAASLLFILVLSKFGFVSLLNISLAFVISPVLIYLIVTPYMFRSYLRRFLPSLKVSLDRTDLKALMGLGIKFFIIQISTIIMFSSGNLLISQLFSPSEVTPYNVSYRLFSSCLIVLSIIMGPFWSAFTEANAQKDYPWILKSMKKLVKLWGIFSVGILGLWLLSPYVIEFWVGENVEVSYPLLFQFALYSILMGWINPFAFYVNSVGKVKLQIFIAIVQCILTVPLAIFFAKGVGLGPAGVMLATNVVFLISVILLPIQYNRLIKGRAKGIWNQ